VKTNRPDLHIVGYEILRRTERALDALHGEVARRVAARIRARLVS
jgi:hypothetical protein